MAKKSLLTNVRIPLGLVVPTSDFVLLGVRETPKFDDDGNRTTEIVGFTYTVGDPINFGKLNVKVETKYPVISPEDLQKKRANGENVIVRFENPTICLYWNSGLGAYADSFKADSVTLCNKKAIMADLSDEDLGLD